LLREFNHQNDVTVPYKAFYNRLSRQGFEKFMRRMFVIRWPTEYRDLVCRITREQSSWTSSQSFVCERCAGCVSQHG